MVLDITSVTQQFHAPNTLNTYPRPQYPNPPCRKDVLLHFEWIKHEARGTRVMSPLCCPFHQSDRGYSFGLGAIAMVLGRCPGTTNMTTLHLS